ncbi:unnamed protein product [Miscanthus lutarioriparius]|uniref:Clp R domain-containing protein n=1 Tax=Miscanthus lutarioriparius TaxID=422564 RepID=A0A811SJ44_9POAL|nr:unnamed protein product [Miscanthus lutarioriparius]
MPTPVPAARQCLAPAAVVTSARRRAHAQTTSLHLIASLLAPTAAPLLHDALVRARSAAYSPPNRRPPSPQPFEGDRCDRGGGRERRRRLTCGWMRGGDEGERGKDSDRRGRSTNNYGKEGEVESSASRRAEQGEPDSCHSRLHAAAATADKAAAAAATVGKATPTININENSRSQTEMRQRDNIFRYGSADGRTSDGYVYCSGRTPQRAILLASSAAPYVISTPSP